jgi:hypothetical protein
MMKMRTRKPAAMIDSGSAIQAETSKHAYIAAHVVKNPPNDVASCAKLRARIGGLRMSGFVCVAIASKAMLVSSPISRSERDAHGGDDPLIARLLQRLYILKDQNGKGDHISAGGIIVGIACQQVRIRPTLETARAAGSEGNEHHDDPRSVLQLLGDQTHRERNNE